MVPERFFNLLMSLEEFSAIRRYYERNGRLIETIPQREFNSAAEAITANAGLIIAKSDILRTLIKRPTMDGTTLMDILSPNSKVTYHGSRMAKLQMLLVLANKHESEWRGYIYPEEALEDKIGGYWYVYRWHKSTKEECIKRTVLYIKEKGSKISNSFQSLYYFYSNGVSTSEKQFLIMRFENLEASVEIIARIPIIPDSEPHLRMLSGVLQSTKGKILISKPCLLLYEPKPLTEKAWKEEISYSTNTSKNDVFINPDEELVVEYLRQKRNMIVADFFNSIYDLSVLKNQIQAPFAKLCGEYFIFFPYVYSNDKSLYQSILTIDPWGNAEQRIVPLITDPEFQYNGTSEIREDNLWVSIANRKRLKSEYLFKIPLSSESHNLLFGLSLDSDYNGDCCSDAVIAVRSKMLPFEPVPKILRPDDKDFKTLDEFLKGSRIDKGIDEYFYISYRSIRRQKRADGNKIVENSK